MKTKITALIIAAATFAMSLVGTQSVEARMTKALNDTASTGMNALDFVLQRPLGNSSFEHKRFGDHFFLGFGGGLSVYDTKPGSGFRPGMQAEISFGDWITPVHGWRLNIGGGTRSKHASDPWTAFGSVSADYLMNFSSLLRGYNPQRRVEAIGALGAEYRRLRNSAVWGNGYGFRAALQIRFNVQRNLYLYVEPRLGLYGGKQYSVDSFRRLHYDLSFNVGLGYRLLSKKERMAASTPFYNTADSHIFFGAGGGVWAFARKVSAQRKHPFGFGSFFVGKYFTPTAGIRVKANFGRIDRLHSPHEMNRYLATGSLDFVWNLNSAFGGYRPDQIFDLSLNIGPALAYADKTNAKFYPGAEASLTAMFRLSPNWGIFVEPEIQLFTRKFNREVNGGGYGPIISMSAGLRYTLGNFKYNHPDSYKEYAKAKNNFITFAVAPAKRWRDSFGKGISGHIGVGQRFSPISSWRASVEGDFFSHDPNFVDLTANADYLFSLSTGMAGFNPYRVFDLSGLVGIMGGIGHHHNGIDLLYGGRIGLHGAFRLSDALDLYLEPQLLGTKLQSDKNGWTPEFRFMIGLKYRLGTASGVFGSLADSHLADGRNYVSLSGGPSFFSSTFDGSLRRVGGSVDISLGRWFSRVSGARIGYNFDITTPGETSARRPYLSTIHADYLLNVTSLMDHNPMRRFHIIGIVGTGLGFSNLHHSSLSPVLTAGAQLRYNFPNNIDIHIEPNATAYLNRMVPGYTSGTSIVGVARVMAGLSYRF